MPADIDQPDPLPEAMDAAYARYLRAAMMADPRVLAARTVADLRTALVACLVAAECPLDITVERDLDDSRRVNIMVTPWPALMVTAIVRR